MSGPGATSGARNSPDPPPAPSQGNCDPGQLCTYYTTEQIFAVNPALGALSYDNCLYAFVTIFQAVSLEGWVDQMYMLGVTTDPTTATIYYIAVVVLGAPLVGGGARLRCS